jgi:hypothetical protein
MKEAETQGKADAAPFEPHADASAGPWAAESLLSLLSSEAEDRMIKIPHGVDHFAKFCPNLKVLAQLDEHFEHLGIEANAALKKHREKHFVPVAFEGHHHGTRQTKPTFYALLEPVRDLKSYLLINEDTPKLIRMRVLSSSPAFPQPSLLGAIVLEVNKESGHIEKLVDQFDQRVELFTPSPFTRTMVVCNLVAMHHRLLREKQPGAPAVMISGSLAPAGMGYSADFRWKGPRQVADVEEALRVVKLLETPDGRRMDVLCVSA